MYQIIKISLSAATTFVGRRLYNQNYSLTLVRKYFNQRNMFCYNMFYTVNILIKIIISLYKSVHTVFSYNYVYYKLKLNESKKFNSQ